MKKKILIILFAILLIGIAGIIYIYVENEDKVAILGYHGVLPKELNTSGDNLIVDAETFEQELKLLKKLGYHTMTLEEFECWKNGECKKPHKSVLITFDDGYQNNYDYAYELLKKYDMNAVVFCVGVFVESNDGGHFNKEVLQKISEEYPNVEIASHSYDMHFHSDKTYEQVMEDASKMSNLIDSKYYAYPFGDYNDEYIRALKDSGFSLAFTFGPKREHRKADISDDNYKIPRLNISNDMSRIKFLLRLFLPM